MTATLPPADSVDDQPARDRILADLDTNLLVEAGAGSGKTTSLVGRMLSLVRRGTPVERIAAVTFTRKAANELRERFEVKLESELRAVRERADDPATERRLAQAREELDRAFLGTIHSFCGRLLREHPLEAGLDPAFEEVSEEEWPEIRHEFWNRWLERRRREKDPVLGELRRLGIDPRALYEGFEAVVRYPDVEFPTGAAGLPDPAVCRRKLRALLSAARALMPAEEPEGEWDKLQRTVRRLEFLDRTGNWGDVAAFCDAVASLSRSACAVTQNRWPDRKAAKALGEDFAALVDGEIADLLRCWREHRYPLVMRVLRAAAGDFERERLATGRLGFEDLLLGSVRLLRGDARARRALGLRYRHLLVDEFQDTDPIQAEVCFLLASDPEEGDDWRTVRPRDGALFVVGDPKQSIYRFRRADIQTYELVKTRLGECGAVLALTKNFRSVHAVGRFVDDHFRGCFPEAATPVQAAFVPLLTQEPGTAGDGVYCYPVRPTANNKEEIVAACAARVASWVAARVERGECAPGDFLVLGYQKWVLESYARALAERNVPVNVTGAGLPKELELEELVVALRALADPANPVLVAAALEGLLFGCSPADLWEARRAGLDFSLAHRPASAECRAGRALARMHEWWIVAQRHPADVLLDRILDDTGLLAWAASLPLGENRAGTLLHLVEAIRASAHRSGGTLSDAIDAIERTLASASTDVPLRPGRADAVRVMNLHKAKGLEARVVVLAAPVGLADHDVEIAVQRDPRGAAAGGIRIRAGDAILAQPPGWAAMAAEEQRFLDAEFDRLLYVAATRAERELVVSRLEFQLKSGPAPDKSAWAPLRGALERCATLVELPHADPPGRRTLEADPGALADRAAERAGRRADASVPGFALRTVTESVKARREEARSYDLEDVASGTATGDGAAWGRVAHRSIEAMGRGRSGAGLSAYARAVILDEFPLADEAALAALESRLDGLLRRVASSDAWRRLTVDGRLLELGVMTVERGAGGEEVTEGVVDAAVRTADGWVVIDWKTDEVTDDVWEMRRAMYETQAGRYAEMLARLSGAPASAEIVRLGGNHGSSA